MGDLYLGRPGTVLAALPCPQPGADRSPNGHEGTHELLGGGYAVDRAPHVCRSWQMDWSWDDTLWWQLSAFYRRQYGPGPYALCDPAQINYLTANQAAGTIPSRSPAGFAVAEGSGEALASSDSVAYIGDRSLAWTIPGTVTSGILTLPAPQPLLGWPTPDTSWSLQVWLRLSGDEPAVDVRARLRWLDAAGDLVSTSDGLYTTITQTGWTSASVSGTRPAGAVYVVPQIQADGTTVSAMSAVVHVGAAQLQIGAPTDWRPGEGPALVAFARLRETAQLVYSGEHRRAVQAAFLELATEEEA